MNYNQRGRQWLANELDKRDREIERLKMALEEVATLIDNSQGVVGLHMKGNIAMRDDLLLGGRYEEWLGFYDQVSKEI